MCDSHSNIEKEKSAKETPFLERQRAAMGGYEGASPVDEGCNRPYPGVPLHPLRHELLLR